MDEERVEIPDDIQKQALHEAKLVAGELLKDGHKIGLSNFWALAATFMSFWYIGKTGGLTIETHKQITKICKRMALGHSTKRKKPKDIHEFWKGGDS